MCRLVPKKKATQKRKYRERWKKWFNKTFKLLILTCWSLELKSSTRVYINGSTFWWAGLFICVINFKLNKLWTKCLIGSEEEEGQSGAKSGPGRRVSEPRAPFNYVDVQAPGFGELKRMWHDHMLVAILDLFFYDLFVYL